MKASTVKDFILHHFRHFNAATLVNAAEGYRELMSSDGRMLMAIAGAMSTAEIGLSLAEMIRRGKVNAISCTGANLEEDVFNLVAHDHYVQIPNYRDLAPSDEQKLLERHLNRVTDTCIPEEEAMRHIERVVIEAWMEADRKEERFFPHEFFYRLLREEKFGRYQINSKDSWLIAACEKNLPLFVPGWEDSTLGNIYASYCLSGNIRNVNTVRGGIEYMMSLAQWYQNTSGKHSIGFFQIGGGIAGDFPICVVPMLRQDMGMKDIKLWSYFCQISDSTTSYGSYSGAVPNEKITWEKIAVDTPSYIIESDATIVAPLIFAYVLD